MKLPQIITGLLFLIIANFAGAHCQVVGAFSVDAAALLAEALAGLGAERALTLHGAGGLDELSLAGENQLFEVRDGQVRPFSLRPEEAGLGVPSPALGRASRPGGGVPERR